MVRVLFIHPDLGIGGAERLVVDAGLALQQCGHSVEFLTNHHDQSHCFEETRNGTLKVQTIGDWIPRSTFGRFTALWAYIRMFYASFYTAFILSYHSKFDVIIVDSISFGIPILKLAKHSPKIIFYCHFPDLLMAPQNENFLRKIYRYPLNFAEEFTTAKADVILVNSKFTCRVFKETFKSIKSTPSVLYPSLNTKFFDETVASDADTNELAANLPSDSIVFLSINRFERKKNIPLALKAFKQLGDIANTDYERCYLILAGGYDKRITENVEHFNELTALADELGVGSRSIMLRSPSDKFKLWLLKRCTVLLYTPSNEHFGIVPIEAMYMQKPVIACNSGGPTETLISDETGYLVEPNEIDYANAMSRFVARDRRFVDSMGEKGRKRVQQHFSFDVFTEKLNSLVREMTDVSQQRKKK